MKKTSLKDIADNLNVSKTLVSFVLNGQGDLKGISSETQKKVLDKVRELNYKPNQIARGLRLGKSHTIGLIVADISNKFYAKIAKQIEKIASRYNYNLIFCSSDENPEKEAELINMLRDRQTEGLIISTTQKSTAVFTQLKKEKYPFVLIDRHLPRLSTNFVGVDNYSGAFEATEHLIKNGYERIAFLKISPSHLSTIKERELGYRSALKYNGIRINNHWIRTIAFSDIRKMIRSVLPELMQSPFNINAIFSANNNISVACMEYMNEMNLRMPHDLALVSFDDIDLFRFSHPSITSVAQPLDKIGEMAVNILMDEINGLSKNQTQLALPVKFIERKSSGILIQQMV